MTDYKDRRGEDRDIKELFNTKLEVLDTRYGNLRAQNEKLEGKIDKLTDAMENRMRKLETAYHGQDNQKGLLVRVSEQDLQLDSVRYELYGNAASQGLKEDVADMKAARKKRDHLWAIMGGGASAFVLWLLTKFGDTGWMMLTKKFENAPTPTIIAQQAKRRVIRRYRAAPPPPPQQQEAQDATGIEE